MCVCVCGCIPLVMDNDYRLDDEDSKLDGLSGLGETDEKMTEHVNINNPNLMIINTKAIIALK